MIAGPVGAFALRWQSVGVDGSDGDLGHDLLQVGFERDRVVGDEPQIVADLSVNGLDFVSGQFELLQPPELFDLKFQVLFPHRFFRQLVFQDLIQILKLLVVEFV